MPLEDGTEKQSRQTLAVHLLCVVRFIHTHTKELFTAVVVQKGISVVQKLVWSLFHCTFWYNGEAWSACLEVFQFTDQALNSKQTVEVFDGKMKFLLTKWNLQIPLCRCVPEYIRSASLSFSFSFFVSFVLWLAKDIHQCLSCSKLAMTNLKCNYFLDHMVPPSS